MAPLFKLLKCHWVLRIRLTQCHRNIHKMQSNWSSLSKPCSRRVRSTMLQTLAWSAPWCSARRRPLERGRTLKFTFTPTNGWRTQTSTRSDTRKKTVRRRAVRPHRLIHEVAMARLQAPRATWAELAHHRSREKALRRGTQIWGSMWIQVRSVPATCSANSLRPTPSTQQASCLMVASIGSPIARWPTRANSWSPSPPRALVDSIDWTRQARRRHPRGRLDISVTL